MNTTEAILDVLLAFGWERHEEVSDMTPEELEELENHGTFTRDGREVYGVGQTDTSDGTYAFQDTVDDGNILIAPYNAGTVWPNNPEEGRRQEALQALAEAVFEHVTDFYCQSIAFRL
jgi:hypothetical protein